MTGINWCRWTATASRHQSAPTVRPSGVLDSRPTAPASWSAINDETRRSDIWIYDAERGTRRRLTSERHNLAPLWTPDGRRITFADGRLDQSVSRCKRPAELLFSSEEMKHICQRVYSRAPRRGLPMDVICCFKRIRMTYGYCHAAPERPRIPCSSVNSTITTGVLARTENGSHIPSDESGRRKSTSGTIRTSAIRSSFQPMAALRRDGRMTGAKSSSASTMR